MIINPEDFNKTKELLESKGIPFAEAFIEKSELDID